MNRIDYAVNAVEAGIWVTAVGAVIFMFCLARWLIGEDGSGRFELQ